MTEWERFKAAAKAVFSVAPETAAAIRRGGDFGPRRGRGSQAGAEAGATSPRFGPRRVRPRS